MIITTIIALSALFAIICVGLYLAYKSKRKATPKSGSVDIQEIRPDMPDITDLMYSLNLDVRATFQNEELISKVESIIDDIIYIDPYANTLNMRTKYVFLQTSRVRFPELVDTYIKMNERVDDIMLERLNDIAGLMADLKGAIDDGNAENFTIQSKVIEATL